MTALRRRHDQRRDRRQLPGSVYTVSAPATRARRSACVMPREGPEETKDDAHPDGKSGVCWMEITSLVNNPSPRRLPRTS